MKTLNRYLIFLSYNIFDKTLLCTFSEVLCLDTRICLFIVKKIPGQALGGYRDAYELEVPPAPFPVGGHRRRQWKPEAPR